MRTSDPRRYAELRRAFESIVVLPREAQAARLRALAETDAPFAEELSDLLELDRGVASSGSDAGGETPFASMVQSLALEIGATLSDRPPAWIGEYRITGTLGSGGMGVVYLAEQLSPRRTVALKVIRGHGIHGGETAVRRFTREAELQGRLQHPNIALVYEAGVAPERDAEGRPFGPARPFFAMEFVRGEPIVEFVRARAAPVAERIALMITVCDAIEHAHGKGVIHRDLKSANILVDDQGRPRVLDFGIARALDRDHAATIETAAGEVIGTLPYMSPEQVSGRGDEVGVASDVYALGVVLFEVLTGRRPIDLAGRSLPDAVRRITDEEPTRLASFDRSLRGDLETIVARCLEKTPARRYPSAGALAADLRRHLAHEPIEARPPSALYRVQKFTRRHRALVIGAGTAFTALAAATAISTVMAVQASRARNDLAKELDRSKVLTKEAEDARDHLGVALERSTELTREAQEARDRLGRELERSTRLTHEAQEARAQVADHLKYSRIENTRASQSFAFLESLLLSADPSRTGGRELTLREFVVRSADELESGSNENSQVKGMVGRIIGLTLHRIGDHARGERALRLAIESLKQPDENARAVEFTLLQAMTELADIHRTSGRPDEAEALYEEIIALREANIAKWGDVGETAGTNARVDFFRSTALANLGLIYAERGDFARAEANAQRAYEMEKELVDMGHARLRATGIALWGVASARHKAGRHAESIAPYREALRLAEKAEPLGAHAPARIRYGLSQVLASTGAFEEAIELMRPLLAWRLEHQPHDHPDVVMTRLSQAQYLHYRGEASAGAEQARLAVAAAEANGAAGADRAIAQLIGATLLSAVGDQEGADRMILEAIRTSEEAAGSNAPAVVDAMVVSSMIARRAGRWGDARERALEAASRAPDAGRGRLNARREAALALLASDRPDDGRHGADELARVIEESRVLFGPDHPTVGRLQLDRAEALLACDGEVELIRAEAARCADEAARILSRPGGVLPWFGTYATLVGDLARDPALARSPAWHARLGEIRSQIIDAGGRASPELARLERVGGG